jgi:hypothetical protein
MIQPCESLPLVRAHDEEVGFGPARKRDEIFSHMADSCHRADAHVFAAQHPPDSLVKQSFDNAR